MPLRPLGRAAAQFTRTPLRPPAASAGAQVSRTALVSPMPVVMSRNQSSVLPTTSQDSWMGSNGGSSVYGAPNVIDSLIRKIQQSPVLPNLQEHVTARVKRHITNHLRWVPQDQEVKAAADMGVAQVDMRYKWRHQSAHEASCALKLLQGAGLITAISPQDDKVVECTLSADLAHPQICLDGKRTRIAFNFHRDASNNSVFAPVVERFHEAFNQAMELDHQLHTFEDSLSEFGSSWTLAATSCDHLSLDILKQWYEWASPRLEAVDAPMRSTCAPATAIAPGGETKPPRGVETLVIDLPAFDAFLL